MILTKASIKLMKRSSASRRKLPEMKVKRNTISLMYINQRILVKLMREARNGVSAEEEGIVF